MKKKYIEVLIKNKTSYLGKPGTLIQVSKGYARNYLLPQNFVEIPNEKRLQYFQKLEEKQILQEQKLTLQHKQLKMYLEVINKFSIKRKGNNTKGIFGSISEKDIIELVNKTTGIEMSKYRISANNIKTFGLYAVNIQLTENIKAHIQLQILPEIQ